MSFLSVHVPGCSPAAPCVNCKLAAFLKQKLSVADFAELTKIDAEEHTYGPENPAPLDYPIARLDLSIRTGNCLSNDNLLTIGDLVKKSEGQMLEIPNFGRRSLNEIKEVLAKFGHRFGSHSP